MEVPCEHFLQCRHPGIPQTHLNIVDALQSDFVSF
jgi:hypothetical protein